MANEKTTNPSTMNRVILTGKLADLEVKHGTRTDPKAEVLSISGSVQIGDDPSFKVPFRNAFQVKKYRKDGEPRKDYAAYSALPNAVKTIAQVGQEDATTVTLQGRFATNDFVNQNGELIEGIIVDPGSIKAVAATEKSKTEMMFKGAIRSVKEETDKDGEETGRLSVEVVGIDGMGSAIPLKFIVPKELADPFKDGYEPRQTATFSIEYELRVIETAKTGGGIGVQWSQGFSRLERVLVGASEALDDDEEKAISTKNLKAAMEKRKERLASVREWAENRDKQKMEKAKNSSMDAPADDLADDELPF